MGERGVPQVFAAPRLATLTGLVVALVWLGALSSGPADAAPLSFGPSSFSFGVTGQDGLANAQAGGHPDELTGRIDLNSEPRIGPEGNVIDTSVQDVKDLLIDLPPGFLASALATPQCSFAQLAGVSVCPPDTAVGHIRTEPEGEESLDTQIYNMVPEHGVPAEFGYVDPHSNTHALYASVVPSTAGYVLRITARELPQVTLTTLHVTLFGNPTVTDGGGDTPLALLTNPSACSGQPLVTSIHMDSWQSPGALNADGTPDLSDQAWVSAQAPTYPEGLTGCGELRFEPSLALAPEPAHSRADEPAGYEVDLKLAQNEDFSGLATPPLENVALTLPAGVSLSPAAADGLLACQAAGAEGIEVDSPEEGHCPAASILGDVEALTPLFGGSLQGRMFLAQPACSPCSEVQAEEGDVFAVYLEVGSGASGVHLKLKGKVEVGGEGPYSRQVGLQPGQLRVSFAEVPQLPLSELKLKFDGGSRAPLANPQGCGAFQTASELEPWSHRPAPGEAEGTPDATPLAPAFVIAGCENRFAPAFSAGAVAPQTGAYSPLTLTFSRQDREQDFSALSVTLPPGLLAKIAAVPQCPEVAASRGECASVSPDSRIGVVTAAAGSGSLPLWRSGNVYLTGPYKSPVTGAEGPFGLSVVVPALAGVGGIFNLGNIVVRATISINPGTAQLTIVSNPLPQSVDGVPLRLQTVNLAIDRENFIFNPTNCSRLSVNGTLTSAQAASAPVSSPFTVSGCKHLKFTPKLTALTRANGEFAGHGASLHVAIATAPGQANLHALKLDLPQRLPARLETIQKACPEATFNVNPAKCSKASVVGSATVQTPILSPTMAGPAYLVAKGATSAAHAGESAAEKEEAAFPDMVLVLQGEGVRIDLTGGLFVSGKNITSVVFRSIPDVPIRRLNLILPEGKGSILAASSGLCTKKPLRMTTAITGQNGGRVKPAVKVGVEGCKKPKRRKQKRRVSR